MNYSKMKFPADLFLPAKTEEIGNFHPISIIINQIKSYFIKYNFCLFNGKEIENIYYNFESLNISKGHPAYNDSFWLSDTCLLRTQTSCMQGKILSNHKLPIKIISIGKVFRKDFDRTHTPMFHQLEGLIIDKSLNFLLLINFLKKFLVWFFEKKMTIRIRPSYFPFTEPSAEIDIYYNTQKNWIEILGCGLIHPKILNNFKINYNIYTGLAFGIGIERLIMIKYNINDIRLFFDNHIRFLNQFKYIN